MTLQGWLQLIPQVVLCAASVALTIIGGAVLVFSVLGAAAAIIGGKSDKGESGS